MTLAVLQQDLIHWDPHISSNSIQSHDNVIESFCSQRAIHQFIMTSTYDMFSYFVHSWNTCKTRHESKNLWDVLYLVPNFHCTTPSTFLFFSQFEWMSAHPQEYRRSLQYLRQLWIGFKYIQLRLHTNVGSHTAPVRLLPCTARFYIFFTEYKGGRKLAD